MIQLIRIFNNSDHNNNCNYIYDIDNDFARNDDRYTYDQCYDLS